ncbi:hypothetical protein QQF64_002349 [Cirrhinus molitorella]|uniref:Uncharacterized protein n=1 Tax=Cirrhinus molitorella TaxID=172907 RepID=A0ABR3MPX5_9TELE
MDAEARQRKTDDIYENADAMRGKITMETEDSNTTGIQPAEHTVIVLCVTFTQERQQSISKNEKLTNEKDQLTDLTKVFRR